MIANKKNIHQRSYVEAGISMLLSGFFSFPTLHCKKGGKGKGIGIAICNIYNACFLFTFRYCDPVEAAANLGVNSTGVITPSDCPKGYYCPVNTTSQYTYPCPPGTFNNITNLEMENQCLACTAGSYCASYGRFI